MTINAATGQITWTPTEAQGPGVYPVTVRLSDDFSPPANAERRFTVTVNEVNQPPTLAAIPDQVVNELELLTITLAGADADLPAQTLTYTLEHKPEGMQIDPASGVITWTPTEAQGPGYYTVIVRLSDDFVPPASVVRIFYVFVHDVNQAPTLAAIADRTVDEHQTLAFTAQGADADLPAQTLTYSLENAPAGMLIHPHTGQLTWTPGEAHGGGSYTVTVRVQDNAYPPLSAARTFTVTVNETNEPPVLQPIGSRVIDEQAELSFTLSASDPDLPAQPLTYTATGLPQGASLNPTTGAFAWTPSEAQGPGVYTLTFTVTDGWSPVPGTASETITITVNEVNRPPVLEPIANTAIDEGALLTFTAQASDPDLPAQALTFSLVSPPNGASITPGGLFTWTPTIDQGPAVYTLTVRVQDDFVPPGLAETSFTVTVNEVNTPPVIDPIGDRTVDEGELVSFTVQASDPDIPAQVLSYSLATGAPAGASIHPASGLFTWQTSEPDGPGSYPITVIVTDGEVQSSASFTITVNEVNQPPVLEPIASVSVVEGGAVSFTAQASDPDLPAQTLAFRLGEGAPPAASIHPQNGSFTWVTTPTDGPGVYNLTVIVSDGLVETSRAFTISVMPALDLRMSGTAAPNPVFPGQTLTYSLTVTNDDPDGDTATGIEVTGQLPVGVTLALVLDPRCVEEPAGLVCRLPSLAAGSSETFLVPVMVASDLPAGTLLVFAPSAAAEQYDPQPGNNTASLSALVSADQTIFEEDFDDDPGSGWTDTGGGEVTTSTTPSGRNFLGEFNNQEIMLELNELPQHNYVEVSFDLYILRSWDGGRERFTQSALLGPQLPPVIGPDIWEFAVDEETLLSASFANWGEHTQSYPKNFGQGSFPARTGAVEFGSLGYTYEHHTNQDAVYRLSFTTAHTGETLRLYFRDLGLQPIEDESWGLANLRVKVLAQHTPPASHRLYLTVMMR
jgi:uncharacterized repeat protein (TIGR01451 family)